ncbi:ATP-binding protein [Achromobacter anxifer]|uniref:ATP-binding protein n=1 Tax=Achromobacter anxifer TaxID=1287737 RepID=UPI00158FFE33|nr:ATP-binding protein [Achromobacter anxifer]
MQQNSINPFDCGHENSESGAVADVQAIMSNTNTHAIMKPGSVTVIDVAPPHLRLKDLLVEDVPDDSDRPQFAAVLVTGWPGSGKSYTIANVLHDWPGTVHFASPPPAGSPTPGYLDLTGAQAEMAEIVVIDEVWQFDAASVTAGLRALKLRAQERQVLVIMISQAARDLNPIIDALPEELVLIEIEYRAAPRVFVGATAAVLDPTRKHELYVVPRHDCAADGEAAGHEGVPAPAQQDGRADQERF